jgi:hypothetical protein
MKCPKCKNPIEDDAAVCEWCGCTIPDDVSEVDDLSELDELSELDDEFSEMDRVQLKAYIREHALGIVVRKSMTDDDIRVAIRIVTEAKTANKSSDDRSWQIGCMIVFILLCVIIVTSVLCVVLL